MSPGNRDSRVCPTQINNKHTSQRLDSPSRPRRMSAASHAQSCCCCRQLTANDGSNTNFLAWLAAHTKLVHHAAKEAWIRARKPAIRPGKRINPVQGASKGQTRGLGLYQIACTLKLHVKKAETQCRGSRLVLGCIPTAFVQTLAATWQKLAAPYVAHSCLLCARIQVIQRSVCRL